MLQEELSWLPESRMSFRWLCLYRLFFLCAATSSSVLAQSKPDHALLTEVLKSHVVEGRVAYSKIKNDTRFEEYLAQLSKCDVSVVKENNEQLAFWINAYNAFTIKLILDHYPVKSIRDIKQGDKGPWDIVWIKIGGKIFSLNHIEHEIIRKQFDEPRIHMALVCAAKSCPPLRQEAYGATTLGAQLDDNAKIFLSDKSKNRYDRASRTLHLSELFSWYGNDFNVKYGSATNFAMKMLGVNNVKPASIKYLPYDWSLNELK